MVALNLGPTIDASTPLTAQSIQSKFNRLVDYINGKNIEAGQIRDNRVWMPAPVIVPEVRANDGNPSYSGVLTTPSIGVGLVVAKYITMGVWLEQWSSTVEVQVEYPSTPGVFATIATFVVDNVPGWYEFSATLTPAIDISGARLRMKFSNTVVGPNNDVILYSVQTLVWCQSKLTHL